MSLGETLFQATPWAWHLCFVLCACLCHTRTHPWSLISLMGIKARSCFLQCIFMYPDMCQKWCQVPLAGGTFGSRFPWFGGGGRSLHLGGDPWLLEWLRSCETCHFTAGWPWSGHLPYTLTLSFLFRNICFKGLLLVSHGITPWKLDAVYEKIVVIPEYPNRSQNCQSGQERSSMLL